MDLDMTQEEFAARFGFSAQYACYSEQGRDSREDGHALIFSRSSAPRRQCRRLCRPCDAFDIYDKADGCKEISLQCAWPSS